ncbi:hypothetical protein PL684_07590, partial [Phocaeicola vulgatus]|uniref:hypothetical protein n=1 Tax=Phocaeicola vulgatus TaxID=821 RepID=UPI001E373E2E
KGHYTYPMVAQFSTGILAHFSISIYKQRNYNTHNKVLTSRVSTLFSSFFPLAPLLSTFVSVTQKKQLWKLFTEN